MKLQGVFNSKVFNSPMAAGTASRLAMRLAFRLILLIAISLVSSDGMAEGIPWDASNLWREFQTCEAWKGYCFEADVKRDSSIPMELVKSGTFKETLWVIDPDAKDKGDFSVAFERRMKNPGEPHLKDNWIVSQRYSWIDELQRNWNRDRFVREPPMGPRYNQAIIGTYSNSGFGSVLEDYLYCVPGGRSGGRVGRIRGGIERYEYTDLGIEVVSGVQCRKIEQRNDWNDFVRTLWLSIDTKPTLLVKFTSSSTSQPADSKQQITKVAVKDGLTIPMAGFRDTKDLRYNPPIIEKSEFKVTSFELKGKPKQTDWPFEFPTGTEVIDRIQGTVTSIPYTTEELAAIRTATLEAGSKKSFGTWISQYKYRILNTFLVAILALFAYLHFRNRG